MTPEQLTAAKGELTQRLHTACLTIACLPEDGPRAFYSTWPRYRLEWYDAEELGSARTDEAVTKGLIAPPAFTPTPRQVDDCLPALSLLDGLSHVHHRIVMLRAHQLWYGQHAAPDDEDHAHWRGGWRAIAQKCRMNHMKAQRLHARAVSHAFERCLENGLEAPPKNESRQGAAA